MSCFHCGDKIIGNPVTYDDKNFCCHGCKTVYEILSDNGLDNFYNINKESGVKPSDSSNSPFKPLDVPEVFEEFVEFQNEDIYIVTFFLPAIHCSSCIYLLENLKKLNKNIIKSEANFTARTLQLTIKKNVKLSEIAILLDQIGYRPELRPKSSKDRTTKYDKKLILQLGIAGFAFGSVMLWTFPEYLGLDETFEPFRNFSSYLSLIVAIPVFFYSASGYLKSAYTAIKSKQLNLDIPIALGIIVLFFKSSFSVLMQEGPGYMDSFTGFVFFLLIGKWFQSKTYQSMAFDNDPKAYFPLGVHQFSESGEEKIVIIDKLKEGDLIKLFNEEIIPCDIELLEDKATINTSFITGESDLISTKKGDKIYAGSKLIGSAITARVLKTTDRSKFAGIWNNSSTTKAATSSLSNENKLSKYFLIIVFILASAGAIIWSFIDASKIFEIVTAVLVVACPCALALSFPFVYGNALRKFGKNGLFFKNSHEIKKLNEIKTIIFDKTGTLTKDKTEGVQFEGELTDEIIGATYSLTRQSTHPYSKSITDWLSNQVKTSVEIKDFQEVSGKGILGLTENNKEIKLGNATFMNIELSEIKNGSYLSYDGDIVGRFTFKTQLRDGILPTLEKLQKDYTTILLSGDSSQDASLFEELGSEFKMYFNQNPSDKRAFIKQIESEENKIAFIGDGLNDSEALNQASLGISVADDVFRFTPSCDAIIDSKNINKIKSFFDFGKYTTFALNVCMVFSLLYNIIGITFALMGYVTPLFAAILMPLSSITIVFLSTFLIRIYTIIKTSS